MQGLSARQSREDGAPDEPLLLGNSPKQLSLALQPANFGPSRQSEQAQVSKRGPSYRCWRLWGKAREGEAGRSDEGEKRGGLCGRGAPNGGSCAASLSLHPTCSALSRAFRGSREQKLPTKTVSLRRSAFRENPLLEGKTPKEGRRTTHLVYLELLREQPALRPSTRGRGRRARFPAPGWPQRTVAMSVPL